MAGRPKAEPSAGKRTARAKAERVSRAREKGLRRERVAHIRRLMRDFLWEPEMGPELAAKWKLSPRTVERYSTEAHEQIGLSVADKESIAAVIEANLISNAQACRRIADLAEKNPKQRRTAVAALRASREAVEALLSFKGLDGTKKVDIGGSIADIVQVLAGPAATRPTST
jgi:hypothetical protein